MNHLKRKRETGNHEEDVKKGKSKQKEKLIRDTFFEIQSQDKKKEEATGKCTCKVKSEGLE
jgi:hypothetical protein